MRSIDNNNRSRWIEIINYTSHGFSHGDVIRKTITGWSKAQAIPGGYGGTTGIVEQVIDTDNFTLVTGGRMRLNGNLVGPYGFIAGNVYYLSQEYAGKLTNIEAEELNIPVFLALSAYGDGLVLPAANTGLGNLITDLRGYLLGGFTTVVIDVIEGFKFSGETVISVAATASEAVRQNSSVWAESVGYATGGLNSSGSKIAIANALVFSDESVFNLGGIMSVTRSLGGSFSNADYGYICGGNITIQIDTIEKLVFSNNNTGIISATLSSGITGMASNLQNGTYGLVAGGSVVGGSMYGTVQGLTLSNETAVVASGTIDAVRYACGSSSSVRGYAFGGYTGSAPTIAIKGVVFSGLTGFTASNSLGTAVYFGNTIQDDTYTYYLGGVTTGSTLISTIQRLTFSGETTSTISATLATAKYGGAGLCPRVY